MLTELLRSFAPSFDILNQKIDVLRTGNLPDGSFTRYIVHYFNILGKPSQEICFFHNVFPEKTPPDFSDFDAVLVFDPNLNGPLEREFPVSKLDESIQKVLEQKGAALSVETDIDMFKAYLEEIGVPGLIAGLLVVGAIKLQVAKEIYSKLVVLAAGGIAFCVWTTRLNRLFTNGAFQTEDADRQDYFNEINKEMGLGSENHPEEHARAVISAIKIRSLLNYYSEEKTFPNGSKNKPWKKIGVVLSRSEALVLYYLSRPMEEVLTVAATLMWQMYKDNKIANLTSLWTILLQVKDGENVKCKKEYYVPELLKIAEQLGIIQG